jgi:DNA-binding LytR/AlgR family response regulator
MYFTIGICDDEKTVCSQMEQMILGYFERHCIQGECLVWYDGESLISDLKKGIIPTILFLDIELSRANGVEVGKFIRESLKNEQLQIIYISSKTNYAMELFQVHPYDFLIKPMTESRVYATLDKLVDFCSDGTEKYTYGKRGMTGFVPFGDILYLESKDKHLEIHLCSGNLISFRGKLKNEIEKMPEYFMRIGQSYVINIRYISAYRIREVVMMDQRTISITSPYREEAKKKIMNYLEMWGTRDERI